MSAPQPSPVLPGQPPPHPPTSKAELETALARLAERKTAWGQKTVAERIALLEQLGRNTQQHAAAWAGVMQQMRGVAPGTADGGEDWFYGPMVTARCIRLLINALKAGGAPKPPKLWQRADGQWVAEVMPGEIYDHLLYRGWRIEQWIEPGKPPSQGRIYREKSTETRVCLVLGAGNVIGISSTDVLHKLFVENELCIVKLNPVNEVGGPPMEQIFAPLIEQGFLSFCYGGADVGQHLTDHPLVESIHMTGSDKTHDAIVWGKDAAEQQKNKKANTPRIAKHVSSELGSVTPWIVVPGDWSDADLAQQARSLIGGVQNNMSFMCVAPKVLVLHKGWALREKFLTQVEEAMRRVPPRPAYYPGADKRYQAFRDHYANAKVCGAEKAGCVPWTLIRDVPAKKGEYALTNEAFCGVLAEVSIDVPAADFLKEAVRFANDDVWGNLSCTLVVDPVTEKKDPAAIDAAIAALRFGNIGKNAWTGANFALMSNSFGAFPGNQPEDIQSGRGTVHNCLLFDHPQKAVLSVPFGWKPLVPWAANHKGFGTIAEASARFEGAPSLLKVPRIAKGAFGL